VGDRVTAKASVKKRDPMSRSLKRKNRGFHFPRAIVGPTRGREKAREGAEGGGRGNWGKGCPEFTQFRRGEETF